MKKLRLLAAFSVLTTGLIFAGTSLAAGNAQQEINKALLHADFLIKANTLNHMHMHMHHILNCMVGEHGKGFNAHYMNPCKGLGNGAINDETSASKRKLLEQVDKLASVGVTINDHAAAHDVALAIHNLLEQAHK